MFQLKLEVIRVKARLVFKGGKGSGNHGHSGRPGKIGGSSGGGSGSGGKIPFWQKNITARPEIIGVASSVVASAPKSGIYPQLQKSVISFEVSDGDLPTIMRNVFAKYQGSVVRTHSGGLHNVNAKWKLTSRPHSTKSDANVLSISDLS